MNNRSCEKFNMLLHGALNGVDGEWNDSNDLYRLVGQQQQLPCDMPNRWSDDDDGAYGVYDVDDKAMDSDDWNDGSLTMVAEPSLYSHHMVKLEACMLTIRLNCCYYCYCCCYCYVMVPMCPMMEIVCALHLNYAPI